MPCVCLHTPFVHWFVCSGSEQLGMYAPSIINVAIIFIVIVIGSSIDFSNCIIMGSDTDSLDGRKYRMLPPNPRIVCTLLSPYEPEPAVEQGRSHFYSHCF